jgi:hypothetical protein
VLTLTSLRPYGELRPVREGPADDVAGVASAPMDARASTTFVEPDRRVRLRSGGSCDERRLGR